jgi:hypothetical protein
MTMLFAVAVCYWLYKWAVGDGGVDRGGANRPPPPPYRAGAPQNGNNNAGDWGGGGGGWFGGGRGGGGWFGGRPTYNAYNTGAGNPGFWSGLMAGGMLNSVFGGGRKCHSVFSIFVLRPTCIGERYFMLICFVWGRCCRRKRLQSRLRRRRRWVVWTRVRWRRWRVRDWIRGWIQRVSNTTTG